MGFISYTWADRHQQRIDELLEQAFLGVDLKMFMLFLEKGKFSARDEDASELINHVVRCYASLTKDGSNLVEVDEHTAHGLFVADKVNLFNYIRLMQHLLNKLIASGDLKAEDAIFFIPKDAATVHKMIKTEEGQELLKIGAIGTRLDSSFLERVYLNCSSQKEKDPNDEQYIFRVSDWLNVDTSFLDSIR